jgi:hypothetical protein
MLVFSCQHENRETCPVTVPPRDKRPRHMFACLETPSPSNHVPPNTAMDVTILSSRVAARRQHAAAKHGGSATFAQEQRNVLAKALAAAADAAAAAGPPVSTFSWDFQLLNFDQHAAPGASTVCWRLSCGVAWSL